MVIRSISPEATSPELTKYNVQSVQPRTLQPPSLQLCLYIKTRITVTKATMLVHQYELFGMKEDESIEQMYSRFQTLVSGLQILKKSYVASDHVSKILISLPARWRPKVTAIEEAKDLNTLSVEDPVSSLKVHEIGLNEHEPAKKVKSIALPSKGKSSKAFKVIESEDESPDGDSDEDPTEKMAMLSNKVITFSKYLSVIILFRVVRVI